MKHSDIAALMKGAAPVIRDLVLAATKPLQERIVVLETQLQAALAVDHAPAIEAAVGKAVAALPVPVNGKDADPAEIARLVNDAVALIPAAKDGEPGKDADPAEIARMVSEAVAAIPVPKDGEPGRDADPAAVEALVTEKVAAAVAALPAPQPGKDADPELVRALVAETVERAVAGLPVPADGKSVTVEDVTPLIERTVAEAVAALPPARDGADGKDGERGPEGAPGRLALVKAWADEVTYEGECRAHNGATYQALRDTAKEPPHTDWQCIAAAGRDGVDGRSFALRGLYDEKAEYRALDVVALNGASFGAIKDDPGPCPGEGWKMLAAQGKAGKPGEKGVGVKGDRGNPGPGVRGLTVDNDNGLLTLTNGDGSEVTCDLYPLLSKLG